VPDVTNVQVQILTDSPGLGPLEVERFVTYPVEGAMSGLPEVEEIRSLSRFGLSVVTVVFHEGTDIYWARQMVSERLTEARDAIPEGFGEPEMAPISSGLGEIFQFEVRGDGLPEKDRAMVLRDVLESQIAPRLRSVPGVVEINTFGGELRTYQVEVTPERLASYGVSLDDLFEASPRTTPTSAAATSCAGGSRRWSAASPCTRSLDHIREVVVTTTPRARRSPWGCSATSSSRR
jgi:cobalt-zinc-cadmium resistance protein CzcA